MRPGERSQTSEMDTTRAAEFLGVLLLIVVITWFLSNPRSESRPPAYLKYLLYLFLRSSERDIIIGDLQECYDEIAREFGKGAADIWYIKQVCGSVFPLFRRAVLRIGALVWLG